MSGEAAPGQAARYRKRPVTVEAVRWTVDNLDEVYKFAGRENFDVLSEQDPEANAMVFDKLHSTWVLVYVGQWVIKGVKGEFYPCADDVFRETYEDAAQERPAPGESSPLGLKHAVTSNRLGHALAALREIVEPDDDDDDPRVIARNALNDDKAIHAAAPAGERPAPELAAAMAEARELGAAYADLQSEIGLAVSLHCSGNGAPCEFCQRELVRAMKAIDTYARDVAAHERTRPADTAPDLGTAWRLLDEARAKIAAIEALSAEMHARADAPVPPDAVDMADGIVRAQVLHEYATRVRLAIGPDAGRAGLPS